MKKRGDYLFVDENNGVYTISLTPELQDDIGTVGYVEFKDEKAVSKGDALAKLEASKTVLDVPSPLAGKVVEKNTKLQDDPKLLNSPDDSQNWLVKLKDVDESAFNQLKGA
ncbi:MAG: glycine cleavage system protein H [Lentilactobacillus hilgardii]|jgi:glycine cleavage system H lipoate-binding protein|uniref:glycine cleavage system protein H n=1 Tax=Lentilactobacillus hilgardii TaxID=1588 RepID=UPI001CC20E23|nr:glycine cleavage system protein H [Lentilactobacillus hilgardii]MBZ2200288.1 glycine cleavage system protein H [Lentilactobacillus hilgardii]MBZ2203413.1 glycine cleavage system protein H [Lentilactobacillus hilgardii]MCI2020391.1 glycine cleavage system protein H [Lentilactobacillus buchneri]MCI2028643.1 glycine cleavage system protein H [Lentilactobacillus buchneri]